MTRGILGIALLLGCGDAATPLPILECGAARVRMQASRAYGCGEADAVRASLDDTLRFDGRSPPRSVTCRAGQTDVAAALTVGCALDGAALDFSAVGRADTECGSGCAGGAALGGVAWSARVLLPGEEGAPSRYRLRIETQRSARRDGGAEDVDGRCVLTVAGRAPITLTAGAMTHELALAPGSYLVGVDCDRSPHLAANGCIGWDPSLPRILWREHAVRARVSVSPM